jgi:uncharacterized membrane protein
MSDATAIRLIDFGLRIFQVSLILLGPKLWPWLPGRVPERGSTFFGVRVPPGFSASEAGRNILRTFRRRLWIGIFALAGIFAVTAPEGATIQGLLFFGALAMSWLISWVLYGLAERRTRLEAGSAPEPSVRTAMLLPEGKPQSRGMASVAWTLTILPVALPVITGILLASNWSRYPAGLHAETDLSLIAMGASFGLMITSIQLALRLGARGSDWATTPDASLKYRTYLGVMMGIASLAVVGGVCADSLWPLYGAGAGMAPFLVSFPVLLLLVGFAYRMRSRLAKLFDPQSGDPMADRCWKWTFFYYNPGDPAWVVPMRTGIGCSFNHARATVWVVYAIATACYVVAFLQIAHLVPDLIRTESAIQRSLR